MPSAIYEKYKETHRISNKRYAITHKAKKNEIRRRWYQNHKAEIKIQSREYNQSLKREVLTQYGGGALVCVRCGEDRLACLSIDHIIPIGEKRRRGSGLKSGSKFYVWLKKNNYPEGYQTLCMNCQFIKRDENNECARSGVSATRGSPPIQSTVITASSL